jgi:hypothetical protein
MFEEIHAISKFSFSNDHLLREENLDGRFTDHPANEARISPFEKLVLLQRRLAEDPLRLLGDVGYKPPIPVIFHRAMVGVH